MGLGSLVKTVASPIASASGGLGNAFGFSDNEMLSGIPFLGQGKAASRAMDFEADQAATARNFSSAQSLRQMDFQREMSNTVHQRQVEDLKKAGLNPILSANSGAPMASGAQAAATSAKGYQGSGASDSAKLVQDIMRKEGKKAQSIIDLNRKSTELTGHSSKKAASDAKTAEAAAEVAQESKKLQKAEIRNQYEVEKNLGKTKRYSDSISSMIGNVVGGLTNFLGLGSSAKGVSKKLLPSPKGNNFKGAQERARKTRNYYNSLP